MHFQATTPNWPTALLKMPDWSLIKAVNNPSILREARQRWSAAGRDDAKLFTIFRKVGDYNGAAPSELDLDGMRAWWRAHYFTWCDGSYLREYAPFVSAVEEGNEYTDNDLAHNPELLAPRLRSAQAAVDVWNAEFRGRTVHSPDDGEGLIPAACRLVIGNVPVGNDVPREFMRLAIETDNIVGYHAYTHWLNSARDPGDWRWHSGRWAFNEQEHGLKPLWAFTETGPYVNTSMGWKSHGVCDGSLPLLLEAFRAWASDMATTAAYAEGRLYGLGAFFTSGHVGWENYQLDEPQLSPIADVLRPIWKPGTYQPNGEPVMPNITDADLSTLVLANSQMATVLARYKPAPVPTPPTSACPTGKGMLTWHLPELAGALAWAHTARLAWVAVKVHDGPTADTSQALKNFVAAFHAAGVQVYGWGYCYLRLPLEEADAAVQSVQALALDGYLIDAEGEAAASGPGQAAAFVSRLKSGIHKPIGLCSYRYPTLHSDLPWRELLAACTFHAPQVYFLGNTDPLGPGQQLSRSVGELVALKDLPVVPIGSAFPWTPAGGTEWRPTSAQLQNFIDTAIRLKLPGYGFWSWESAVNVPEWWNTITSAPV